MENRKQINKFQGSVATVARRCVVVFQKMSLQLAYVISPIVKVKFTCCVRIHVDTNLRLFSNAVSTK